MISGQKNIRQVITLVELSKIKYLLELYYFNDILSLPLSHTHTHTHTHTLSTLSISTSRVIDVRSEWHTFSKEKSATDQSHVGTAVILYYFRHYVNSQTLNYQNS